MEEEAIGRKRPLEDPEESSSSSNGHKNGSDKILRTNSNGESEKKDSSAAGAHPMGQFLECAICLSFIVEPVTISCGHSFCKMCLVKSLRRHKKKCPSCRAVCYMSPEEAPINSMIKSLALSVDAELYAKRMVEHEEEKKTWDTTVPIFYYNDPLFPNGNLSLHIFEPRYKVMMQRIVNSTRSFAYVPNLSDYTANVGDIALRAVLTEVEFQADGRCLLEAKLEGRFKILEHFIEEGTQGLHYCRMEPFHDAVMSELELLTATSLKAEGDELCVQLMQHASIKQKIEGYHGLPPRDMESFSMWLCGVCLNNNAKKMEMLATRSTLKRLEVGVLSLRNLVNRLQQYMTTKSANHANRASNTSSGESSGGET